MQRRCSICNLTFTVCQSCDRGHWYCGASCSAEARRRCRSRASKRYRKTQTGQASHVAAQRRYRQRKRRRNDSEIYHSSAISNSSLTPQNSTTIEGRKHDPSSPSTTTKSVVSCHFCKRPIDAIINGRLYRRSYGENMNFNSRTSFYDYSGDTS
jgi:hypothetical protein